MEKKKKREDEEKRSERTKEVWLSMLLFSFSRPVCLPAVRELPPAQKKKKSRGSRGAPGGGGACVNHRSISFSFQPSR